jgi:hypothetical protein
MIDRRRRRSGDERKTDRQRKDDRSCISIASIFRWGLEDEEEYKNKKRLSEWAASFIMNRNLE